VSRVTQHRECFWLPSQKTHRRRTETGKIKKRKVTPPDRDGRRTVPRCSASRVLLAAESEFAPLSD